ncbi:unnamed protein product, partial [Prorocentrum cordatum]
ANFDWVLGNAWADHFAKLGAKDIGYAEGYCDLFKMALARAKLMSRYLGFTLCRLFQQQLWESQDRQVLKLKEVCPGASKDPAVRKNQLKWICRFAKARSIEFHASVLAQM